MIKIVNVLYINYLNTNDRIYDLNACNKIIENFNNMTDVFGCYKNDNTIVDSSKITHKVNKLFIKNNILKAEIEILPTTYGNILKEFFDNSCFITKSTGIINPDKTVEVVDFFGIDCAHIEDSPYIKIINRERKLKRILSFNHFENSIESNL